MTLSISNKWEDVSRIFKGYLTIVDGSNLKQFDQLLELEITSRVELNAHYSSQAKKNNAVVGQTSTAFFKIDDTKFLYGPAGTVDKTLLTHITNKIDNELSAVSCIFESVQETDSADSNKFILHKFTGDVFQVTKVRDESLGTYSTQLFIDITSQTHNKEASSAPTTG